MAAVDAHLHLFRDEQEGLMAQGGERRAGFDGVLAELEAILGRGRIGRALVCSALPVELWRRLLGPTWPADEVESRLMHRATRQNEWVATTTAATPGLEAVIGADPTLPTGAMLEHLSTVIDGGAASVRALKIHPALNFVFPHDPRYTPIYDFAVEARFPVISHGGSAAEMLYPSEVDYCAPQEFAPVLRDHPRLQLVVAHFAHPYHDTLIEMAATFPDLWTDLSFVVGAGELTGEALAGAVRTFGIERVLFGSDFPYADPEAGLDAMTSAGLSDAELEAITAGNATRLFRLG